EVSTGLASRDWTIAHELGHLMLRHYVDSDERGCRVDDPFAEYQAERFAALLTSRLAVARRAPRDAVFS
ncbi:ImmA/IrrE family metallo-endopeptidase, partial [Tsukamurella spumae]